MALNQSELNDLAQVLLLLMDARERGITPEVLRERMQESGVSESAANTWIECACILHDSPRVSEARPIVKNPLYRKGTGRKAVAWSDCLWQPPK